MVRIFKTNNLPVPDLSLLFNDPSKANQTNIQQEALKMLQTLEKSSVIKQCSYPMKNIHQGVDLDNILTSGYERFSKGITLVFDNNPQSLAINIYRKNFDSFLPTRLEGSDRNIFEQVKIFNILNSYQSEMEEHEKITKRLLEKKDDSIQKQNRSIIKSNREKTQGEPREKLKETHKESSDEIRSKHMDQKPIWKFPPQIQLSSPAHLAMCSIQSKNVTGRPIGPSDLPIGSTIDPQLLTLLASGIGIYSTKTGLNEEYLSLVISLARANSIRMIFADDSMAYGVNLPVSNIIMNDDSKFGETVTVIDVHSMKTIFQMLGRAGRKGHSYNANIFTTSPDNRLIKMIESYIRGTLDEGNRDEVLNIKTAHHIFKN